MIGQLARRVAAARGHLAAARRHWNRYRDIRAALRVLRYLEGMTDVYGHHREELIVEAFLLCMIGGHEDEAYLALMAANLMPNSPVGPRDVEG